MLFIISTICDHDNEKIFEKKRIYRNIKNFWCN